MGNGGETRTSELKDGLGGWGPLYTDMSIDIASLSRGAVAKARGDPRGQCDQCDQCEKGELN